MKKTYITPLAAIVPVCTESLMEEWWSIGVGDEDDEFEPAKKGFLDDELEEEEEEAPIIYRRKTVWD